MSQVIEGHTIPLFESFCRKNQVDSRDIEIRVGSNPLKVKIASTPESQAKGYMNTKSAPKDNEGILFVYDHERPLSFWMKNVPFDLDILFFDRSMKCIGHTTMKADSGQDPTRLPIYKSEKPCQFALEVRGGWYADKIKGECKMTM